MRCKKCGIQLSANNINDCPNCGTAADQGKLDKLPRGLMGSVFNMTGLVWIGFAFAAILGVLFFFATKSLAIAASVFLLLLAVIAAGFLGLLHFE